MKLFIFILFNFLFLFSQGERGKEYNNISKLKSREAVLAQDVQSFYTGNIDSQKRNQVEFWEDGIFIPKLKR
jgi:hypothetical protein